MLMINTDVIHKKLKIYRIYGSVKRGFLINRPMCFFVVCAATQLNTLFFKKRPAYLNKI
jgi:hypothetical protein